VTLTVAAAIGVATLAGVSGQPDTPVMTHEHAGVNGVHLHARVLARR
jgi:hypothetical protein